jgi:hypothetical protein
VVGFLLASLAPRGPGSLLVGVGPFIFLIMHIVIYVLLNCQRKLRYLTLSYAIARSLTLSGGLISSTLVTGAISAGK